MSFNNNIGKAEYIASANQTIFTIVFKIYNSSDIKVYQTKATNLPDDTTDILIETLEYTVTIDGDNGGVITLVNGASLNDSITIVRGLLNTRVIEYQELGDLYADTLNTDQNYQTYLIADQTVSEEKYMKVSNSVQGVNTTIPSPVPLNFLQWDATAKFFINTNSLQADGFLWTAADIYTKTEIDVNQALKQGDNTKTFKVANGVNADEAVNKSQQDLKPTGYKNLLINALGLINQIAYISGTATVADNENTLDKWRVVLTGESLIFSTVDNVTSFTAPLSGAEQIIDITDIVTGTYSLTINGTATTQIAQSSDNVTYTTVTENTDGTFPLLGGLYTKVSFFDGTFSKPQLELGTVKTPFELRPKSIELFLCKQSYQTFTDVYQTSSVDAGGNFGSQTMLISPMRAIPTAIITETSLVNVDAGTVIIFFLTEYMLSLRATATAAGRVVITCNIILDARL